MKISKKRICYVILGLLLIGALAMTYVTSPEDPQTEIFLEKASVTQEDVKESVVSSLPPVQSREQENNTDLEMPSEPFVQPPVQVTKQPSAEPEPIQEKVEEQGLQPKPPQMTEDENFVQEKAEATKPEDESIAIPPSCFA